MTSIRFPLNLMADKRLDDWSTMPIDEIAQWDGEPGSPRGLAVVAVI